HTRTPQSTLFPYTTLFRSTPPPCDENCDRKSDRRLLTITLSGVRRRRNRPPRGRRHGALGRSVRGGRGGLERPGQVGDSILHVLDRKSTRLNSSHVKISYA